MALTVEARLIAIKRETSMPPAEPHNVTPTVLATLSTPANFSIETALRYAKLTSIYKMVTVAVPRISARGRFLSGFLISAPMYEAAFHPLYANATKTRITAKEDLNQKSGLIYVNILKSVPCPATKIPAIKLKMSMIFKRTRDI